MTDPPADQQEVIDWLGRPEHWAGPGDRLERIDTHGAIIFLAGERVLKLKRAVKFDYMDFSTLARRRACCEAELRLNRRTAPSLYLNVLPVTREPDGGMALAGEGPAIDWVVEMRRFDQDTLFDRMIESGRLNSTLIEQAAEAIADLHRQAAARTDYGGRSAMLRVLENNRRELQRHVGSIFDRAQVENVAAASDAALARLGPDLDRRREGGRVRQCHGDLHLQNICLVDGRPTLFDCIEFNDDFAVIDCFYDIAFPLMDLGFRQQPGLAGALLNRYLESTEDYDGLRLLPLFLSARAAIRAHVSASIAGFQREAAAADAKRNLAARYLDYAERALRSEAPRLIAIGGLSGSGKSTVARALAPAIGSPPGAVVLRSDVIRKQMQNAAPTERLPPEQYTPERSAAVYAELRRRAAQVLATGCSVIADAVHARPDEREAIARIAAEAGVPFTGVWLEGDPDELRRRLGARRGDVSDADAAVLQRQLGYALGAIDWQRIESGGALPATLAAIEATL